MSRQFLRILLLSISACVGCQHTHLRHVTTNQAATLTDLHYQQVLDNLAMIVSNPHTMPYFVIPKEGVAQVDTSGEGSLGAEWSPTLRNLGITGSRATSGNWGLEPINESEKLIRMRCAYQLAAGSYTATPNCHTCDELFHEFYGEKASCYLPCTGWFGYGDKGDVPSDACHKGRYGNCYVWVCADGVYELSRLTTVILDFALRSPEPPPAVKVVWELTPDQKGLKIKEIESVADPSNIVSPNLPSTDSKLALPNSDQPPTLSSPLQKRGTIKDKGFPNYLQRAIPIRRN